MVDPITAVKNSCARIAALSSSRVKINDEACEKFALDLVSRLGDLRASCCGGDESKKEDTTFHDYEDEWTSLNNNINTTGRRENPVTIEEEVSAMATLHLLNFGHGHKQLLRELKLGKYKFGGYGSAYVTMMEGVGRATLKGTMSSQRMVDWTPIETKEFFFLPSDCLLASQITDVLRETGSALLSKGYNSLGGFIIQILSSSTSNNTVSSFVRHVIDLIPAFRDEGTYQLPDGEIMTVHFYKKAFLLANDIPFRFGLRGNMFNLKGLESLTVMADNVLPAVLRAKGVLELDDAASEEIAGGVLPMGDVLEIELRALSIEASEHIVSRVNQNLTKNGKNESFLTCAELDLWLWGILGKEEGLRDAPRHFTPTTVYY